MKKRDLIQVLMREGCVLVRSNKHEIYELNGFNIPVPHGNDISKYTAEAILKDVKRFKKKKRDK